MGQRTKRKKSASVPLKIRVLGYNDEKITGEKGACLALTENLKTTDKIILSFAKAPWDDYKPITSLVGLQHLDNQYFDGIKMLLINGSEVSDLSPIKDLPIKVLGIGYSKNIGSDQKDNLPKTLEYLYQKGTDIDSLEGVTIVGKK